MAHRQRPDGAARNVAQMASREETTAKDAAPHYFELTHRPLQSLVFLLPLIAIYEIGTLIEQPQSGEHRPGLAAPLLLRAFFSLFGAQGGYLPGFCVVALLLALQLTSRQRWRAYPAAIPIMAAESLLWAMPLVLISDLIQLRAGGRAAAADSLADEMILSIGAGIYEETVFRLMVISAIMLVVHDVWKVKQRWAAAAAVVVSSLLFAAHHYPPIGTDTFNRVDFAFRALAGGYLAAVYLLRGFGIAVGAHATYNIIVVALLQR